MNETLVKTRTAGLVVIMLVCLSVAVAGCESLGATAATDEPTTTEAPTTSEARTTTSTTLEPVVVTMESGSSPCLVENAFTVEGVDYVTVDYVQVKWGTDEWGGPDAKLTNTNPKLRTFIVPPSAEIDFWRGEYDPEELEDPDYVRPPATFGELRGVVLHGWANSPEGAAYYGFWYIEVRSGSVVSLIAAY